ncbi:transcriptional regulator PAI 2-type [Protomyces lactucae-debilis]|uniref:Transcriptional regulator PAI 2-type n=1 Tax=Protomyces lactucae-debilis TaxID=2754530 RepID=A0A1Y2EPZ0_PROLT|nr:transcriptional regulator PAI 2-type [Protomyces lactucae-debilis]ORY73663.1 transcriptional regulator PAI 2-type [Protomyces lactucae-debilis]
MYIRAVHAEGSLKELFAIIKQHPLGLFITHQPSELAATLQASHIPWVLDVDSGDANGFGRLRGHLARANPQAKALIEAANQFKEEALVMFTVPAHHYITPKFYKETKPTTGKVVPTWNYAAVQVYGKLRVFGDKSDEADVFLDKQIDDLSSLCEESMGYTGGDAPQPWQVSDAPAPYTAIMKKAIVGVEISITRIEGKNKMGQELKPGDRAGLLDGLESMETEVGSDMAERTRRHDPTRC